MTPLAQFILVSLWALATTVACARVNTVQPDAVAPATALSSADAVVVPSDPQGEDALAVTRRLDQAGRVANGGELQQLAPAEHMRRAAIYHTNRAFDEARQHWQAVISRYPEDTNVPAAYFGIGRTLYQQRRYAEALPVFQQLGDNYSGTEAGRDGFYYVGATLLRLNRPGDAAARYAEYTQRFPQGERIENAYLNTIDSLREAGRADESIAWVERTRQRFRGTPTETNAMFARLRLDVARGDWAAALRSSDELSRARFVRAVNTSAAEVAYLRAFSLEQMGQKEQAVRAYQSIPDTLSSYYGGMATARLLALGSAGRSAGAARDSRVRAEVRKVAGDYPAPYRDTLLRAGRERSLDPRLLLAIMRQESNFNPRAKSAAGARGLLQMTPDAAAKYAPRIGLKQVREDDLYTPETNILLASEYVAELFGMFPSLPEAVAASYNGGEDNVERWVRRAVHSDPGIFTAEVGFTETKDYVVKVLANYRAYKLLYTEDLRPLR